MKQMLIAIGLAITPVLFAEDENQEKTSVVEAKKVVESEETAKEEEVTEQEEVIQFSETPVKRAWNHNIVFFRGGELSLKGPIPAGFEYPRLQLFYDYLGLIVASNNIYPLRKRTTPHRGVTEEEAFKLNVEEQTIILKLRVVAMRPTDGPKDIKDASQDTLVFRYIIKGDGGIFEGYAECLFTSEHMRIFIKDDGDWVELEEDSNEFEVNGHFCSGLWDLARRTDLLGGEKPKEGEPL